MALLALGQAMIFELEEKLTNGTKLSIPEKVGWAMYSATDSPSGSSQAFVSFRGAITKVDEEPFKGAILMGPPAGQSFKTCEPPSDPNFLFMAFDAPDEISMVLDVNKTGYYQMTVLNCGLGSFVVKGVATWSNPYGYLPGDIYMKLPVSGLLALFYLAVAIFYMIPMILRRKILLNIQYGIFIVLVVGVIEVSAWYFYRLERNNSGSYSNPALLTVVFIANIKRTLTRVLLLLMAMGVGVVKWTVGNTRVRIAVLALSYLCFAFLAEMIKELQQIHKKEIVQRSVFITIGVGHSMLDTCFYYWIILSIIRTIQQLGIRRQTLKLEMYKWFFGLLAIAGISALLFAVYLFISSLVRNPLRWESDWIQDMYWEFLFFVVMTAIAVLWRPRANNTRYGYAEYFPNASHQESSKPTDEEMGQEILEIVSGGELTHRKRGPTTDDSSINEPRRVEKDNYESSREKNLAELSSSMGFDDKGEFYSVISSVVLDDDDEEEVSLDTQLKKID